VIKFLKKHIFTWFGTPQGFVGWLWDSFLQQALGVSFADVWSQVCYTSLPPNYQPSWPLRLQIEEYLGEDD